MRALKEKLRRLELKYEESIDLVELIWEDRPALPQKPVWILEERYAGMSRADKLKKVREAIHHACPDAVIQARTGGDEFEII